MMYLAQLLEVDTHRERVSHYTKYFLELNQGGKQFFEGKKDLPTFEQLKNLNIKVFELSSNDKTPSAGHINKYY